MPLVEQSLVEHSGRTFHAAHDKAEFQQLASNHEDQFWPLSIKLLSSAASSLYYNFLYYLDGCWIAIFAYYL